MIGCQRISSAENQYLISPFALTRFVTVNQTQICKSRMQKKAKGFLIRNKQNPDLNQYWYSDKTILFLARQAAKHERCCFLSTPSIFYALENPNFEKPYFLFDLDEKFAKKNPNYFKYDFNHPEAIPEKFHGYFDFVLVDPPFITKETWQKFATAVNMIIRKDEQGKPKGNILLSTIDENQQFLTETLSVKKRAFKPSIPNLVYQYSLYSNYQCQELDEINQELNV